LDLEQLAPRFLQNKEAHINYLKYTQEQADILQEIVEQAKAKQPLDNELDFTSETQKPELKVYSRKPKNVKNVGSSKKAKIVESKNANHSEPNHTWGSNATDIPSSSSLVMTVRFGNDHIARIIGYGDYQLGNVTISRVYYVEGLGHNLFSVGQFCDADLEVAFWKNTCFIRNLEGVDLLSGSRDTNLYTISLDDMLKTSPILLEESDFESWKIRIERYIHGKHLEKLIWKSIKNGPSPHPMITITTGEGEQQTQVTREKADEEFTEAKNNKEAKEIWENVELLMQGSDLTEQQKKETLFDQYERFRANGNESIHDYFGKYVTIVKNSKDISTMSYVDLYTHLKRYEQHALKTLSKMNQTSGNADPLAYMAKATQSTSSHLQYVLLPL
ncbi:hypothetical protein Tco_0390963, partial [Tanacetum coccineum]